VNAKAPRRIEKTTEPLVPIHALNVVAVEPEWAKVSWIVKRFGIGRTTAFHHIRMGSWKSVLLRDRDKKSGIRLIYVPSVRDHLNRLLADAGNTRSK